MKSTRKSAGKMTKVVFRRYPDGQVIALFPDIPWSGRRGEITSYMHVASMAQPTMRRDRHDTASP